MAKKYTCKAKGCRNKFEKTFSSTQDVCGVMCAIALSNEKKAKKKKVQATQNRKALRELNRRDLRWQHKRTQEVFNRLRVMEELEWFRARGREPECISCGKTKMDWCCGHFKTVGAQGSLRYERLNTHLQCNRYCNMGLSGNISGNKKTRGYLQGLIDRHGKEQAQFIVNACEAPGELKPWTWEALESMRAGFNIQIRRLES